MNQIKHSTMSEFQWWLSPSSRQSYASCQIVFLKVYRLHLHS
ncbi:hypothetical protein BH18ACI2_BH18ACI2_29570 [soil metagenome]